MAPLSTTTELVSTGVFEAILTFLLGGLSSVWFVYDTINLIRSRNADRSDPIVRDRHFGYVMGIVIALVGIYGTLRFHGLA